MKTYESASGRSGILKTNSGDVSLSINIPNIALNELLEKSGVGKSTTTGETKENIKNEASVKDESAKEDAASKGGW